MRYAIEHTDWFVYRIATICESSVVSFFGGESRSDSAVR